MPIAIEASGQAEVMSQELHLGLPYVSVVEEVHYILCTLFKIYIGYIIYYIPFTLAGNWIGNME